jgi:cellulose synthase/poly-beta-1,6-N-acetylglucosamine synthase-like glycosyltransferase
MFEIIFFVCVLWYIGLATLFLSGTMRKFPKTPADVIHSASVLVAARNEEENILKCLESLAELDYPKDKLEIILIDDKSTDNTGAIIDEFIKDKPHFKKITSKKEIDQLKGKTNALANALEIAKGEIILTTDADCRVPKTWVKTITSYYTPEVGTVSGFTYQDYYNGFSGMQSLDFIFLLTASCGTINTNLPISCIGNNMSYRKAAYDEVGGYGNLPFSVTEDFNLVMAIRKLDKYKLVFPLDKNALVVSLPVPDYKTLYHQKKRWAVGGLLVPKLGYFILACGYLMHAAMLAAPFFWTPVIGELILLKIFIDFVFMNYMTSSLGIRKSMKYFLQFEIYYIIYVILLPFIIMPNQTVTWKGRKY